MGTKLHRSVQRRKTRLFFTTAQTVLSTFIASTLLAHSKHSENDLDRSSKGFGGRSGSEFVIHAHSSPVPLSCVIFTLNPSRPLSREQAGWSSSAVLELAPFTRLHRRPQSSSSMTFTRWPKLTLHPPTSRQRLNPTGERYLHRNSVRNLSLLLLLICCFRGRARPCIG